VYASVGTTPPILIDSCSLPQPFHGDPADQIIVATARHHQAISAPVYCSPVPRARTGREVAL
jgi:PIN domain nuclease of toxin-antitoxin system